MPQSATLPTGGGDGIAGGISSLPGVVKVGLIGGGLGLAFFLWKRASSGGTSTNQPTSQSGQLTDSTYGIPNTAVMLGSLQQEMLNLSGQQGADTANLSDLLSGGFQNVGSLFDAQTAAIQGGLTDLQTNVINNQNTNTQTILDSLAARGDLLQQLIQSSSGAETAAFQSFADSTAKGLGAITAQQNAEMAAIGALGTNVSTQQAQIIGQIQGLQSTTTALQSGMNTLLGGGNLGSGYFVGTDFRVHVGNPQGSGQAGWSTTGTDPKGSVVSSGWLPGMTSSNPNVFLTPRTGAVVT